MGWQKGQAERRCENGRWAGRNDCARRRANWAGADVSVRCDRINRDQSAALSRALREELAGLDAEEFAVLNAVEWVKEHGAEYFSTDGGGAAGGGAEPGEMDAGGVAAAAAAAAAAAVPKGLMREWCSFVSLYKDSYCSGPVSQPFVLVCPCSATLVRPIIE